MPQLTDAQLAVYRPWAWVELGDLKINYPQGPDQKFRWLKDFRWTIGETQGASVQFTLFDNAPQAFRKDWFSFVRSSVVDKNHLRARFQWGISGRDQDGRGIAGFPSQSMTRHSSRIHEMFLSGVSLEYVEGGANYQFTGADHYALTQTVTSFDKIKDSTFTEAVKKLIEGLQKDDILPPDFNYTLDPELERLFPQIKTAKRDWPCQGFPLLLVLQKWMFAIGSPQNSNRPDNKKIGWAVHPVTEKGSLGIHFTTANYISDLSKSDLEIHVNPPDNGPLGPGRHTAVSFRPDFRGSSYWALSPQLSMTSAFTRSITHSGDNGGGENLRKGQGMSSAQNSTSLDDPITPPQALDGSRSQSAGTAANDGSLFVPAAAEVELLGIPEITEKNYLGKTVKLFVWNPAYLNIGGVVNPITGLSGGIQGGWERRPPRDNRWPPDYKIVGISHYISTEGVYSTNLKLVPTGSSLPYGK